MSESISPAPDNEAPVLAVDLDGTLIRGDLSGESLLVYLRGNPLGLLRVLLWLIRGRAFVKRQLARRVAIDYTRLPFRDDVLEFVRTEHRQGRKTVLASGSDELLAKPLADYLGCFDEVLASDGKVNMTGQRKAAGLAEAYPGKGIDYLGNSKVDVPVWRASRTVHVVSSSPGFTRFVQARFTIGKLFQYRVSLLSSLLRQCRITHWLKNLLLFVPLLASHSYGDAAAATAAAIAFLSFSLCASAIYLLNDLVDLPFDRAHPRKCKRPLANGDLQVVVVCLLLILLLLGSTLLALLLPPGFQGVLLLYAVTTILYSARLKRVPLADVLVLAGLYTLRIIAGGAALGHSPTFWLLAFSLFLFFSLALMKRYTELREIEMGRAPDSGRGYQVGDSSFVLAPGMAAGFSAVVILALYINGPAVQQLYQNPAWLWLTCPLLLFWLCHVWFSAYRGRMHDDPILFAVQDMISVLCALAVTVLFLAAL